MNQQLQTGARRFDLDWLRVLAIAMVFVFHTTRFFDPADWHVKNPVTYSPLALWDGFFVLWGMPLIFVVSGAAMYFALKRPTLQFVEDKVRRLLIPAAAGVLLQIPIDVYLERISHRQFNGSFIDFIPHYFDGMYPEGNFAWMGLHLWYLEALFIFSILCLPLLRWLKDGGGQAVLRRLGDFLALPGLVYLLGLPVSLLLMLIDPRSDLGQIIFGGWNLIPYIAFFVAGFVVMSHERVQARIVQYSWLSAGISVAVTIGLIGYWQNSGTPVFGTNAFSIFNLLYGFVAWSWIQTALGLGFKYLRSPRPILAYAGEAVLPFYILHQTVLLVVGYYIVRWTIPDPLKWVLIATLSFAAIMLIYEFLARRFNILRFLFGMKPLSRAPASAPLVAQVEPQVAKTSR